MKKFYSLIMVAFFAAGFFSTLSAQEVVWACNDPEGGVQIWYDYGQNCPASPGSLSGLDRIGFHSGVNGWTSVIDWDAATAVQGANMGNDTFVVRILSPDDYYGVAVTNFDFVFNQGPEDGNAPWDAEGKKDDGAGACLDFAIAVADITENCAQTLSLEDRLLSQKLTVAPNPFTDFATISLDNPARESYTIEVLNLAGQVVNRVEQFRESEFILEKGALPAGFYAVTFTNEDGKFATARIEIR